MKIKKEVASKKKKKRQLLNHMQSAQHCRLSRMYFIMTLKTVLCII